MGRMRAAPLRSRRARSAPRLPRSCRRPAPHRPPLARALPLPLRHARPSTTGAPPEPHSGSALPFTLHTLAPGPQRPRAAMSYGGGYGADRHGGGYGGGGGARYDPYGGGGGGGGYGECSRSARVCGVRLSTCKGSGTAAPGGRPPPVAAAVFLRPPPGQRPLAAARAEGAWQPAAAASLLCCFGVAAAASLAGGLLPPARRAPGLWGQRREQRAWPGPRPSQGPAATAAAAVMGAVAMVSISGSPQPAARSRPSATLAARSPPAEAHPLRPGSGPLGPAAPWWCGRPHRVC